MMRTSALMALTALAALAACVPAVTVPDDVQMTCRSDADCFGDLVCVVDLRRCVAPGAPCIDGRGAADDGASCGKGRICLAAACVDSTCGDGFVDANADEQCDPGRDAECTAECTAPYCGDRLVSQGEACDGTPDCHTCLQICRDDTADCDLDVANGCECTLGGGIQFDDTVLSAVVAGRTALIALASAVWLIDIDTVLGQEVTMAEDERPIAVAHVNGEFLFVTSRYAAGGGSTISLHRITSDSDEVVTTNGYSKAAAVDATHVWLAQSVGLEERLVALRRPDLSEDESLTVEGVDCGERIESCGDRLLCLNDTVLEPRLEDIVKASGSHRTVATSEEPIDFGCSPEGRGVWVVDGRIEELGAVAPIAVLPPMYSGDYSNSEPVVFPRGDPLVYFEPEVANVRAVLVRPDTRGLQEVALYTPLAADDRVILFHTFDDVVLKLDGF